MKWSHLPVAGGLYDQHPELIEDWEIIFTRRAVKEKAEQAAQKPEVNVRGR